MSKKHRQMIVYTSPVFGLVALVLVIAKIQVDRLQSGAEQLAATGRAAIQLSKEVAEGIRELDLERVLDCYAEGYDSPKEGSWSEELRSDRDGIRVYDWRSRNPRRYRKADVAAKLDELLQGLTAVEHSKLKLERVEEIVSSGEAVVRSILWLRGERRDGELFETQLQLRMWIDNHDEGWKIRRQELLHGLTVTGSGAGFGDAAASVGIDFVAHRNPLFATPEWFPAKFGILKYGSAGVSAADYDGDGWYDLYFADGESSRLYRNAGDRGESSFRDVTAEVGLPVDVPGINVALFVDLDNDGDKDLFLGRFMEGNLLYRNDGAGPDGKVTFTDVTEGAGLGRHFVVVATAADYDLDGDLDLYLG
ncbi:MAG: VCBS repeat-containing protein, partial [Thermoanaerobaculia bacterium]